MDSQPVSPAAAADAPVVSGLASLADRYDVLLCDVWGVLHNGVQAYAPACDALLRFRARGGTVVLITNSPRPNGPVREQLDRVGVPREAYDDVVTSGDVTIAAIIDHGEKPLYHIGPERDFALFDAVEQVSGRAPSRRPLAESDYVVCTGLFREETDTPEVYDPDLALMRQRGLTMVCANPDIVVHVGSELRYCAGAIAERYRAQGGDVVYAGKPHAPIYEAALASAAAIRGGAVARSRVLAIGDALHTDVAGAVLQGLDVLFITSGIHRDETHRTGDGQLDDAAFQALIAEAAHRPSAAIAALAW